MRKHLIIIFLLFFSFSIVRGQASVNKILYFINAGYMENCEAGKGDYIPVTITRQDINDSIEMIFPIGGSQTIVYLFAYDSAFIKCTNGVFKDFPTPVRQVQKDVFEGKPTIDLTELPDGNYNG